VRTATASSGPIDYAQLLALLEWGGDPSLGQMATDFRAFLGRAVAPRDLPSDVRFFLQRTRLLSSALPDEPVSMPPADARTFTAAVSALMSITPGVGRYDQPMLTDSQLRDCVGVARVATTLALSDDPERQSVLRDLRLVTSAGLAPVADLFAWHLRPDSKSSSLSDSRGPLAENLACAALPDSPLAHAIIDHAVSRMAVGEVEWARALTRISDVLATGRPVRSPS
jgi:hypothetical protein